MDLNDLKGQLETDLDKAVVSSMVLLRNFHLLDDRSRLTGAYFDPRYIPFYYHLGKKIQPKFLLNIGFGLGLPSGVFLMACKTVEKLLALESPDQEFYSPRLALKNVKNRYKNWFKCCVSDLTDDDFVSEMKRNEWDAVLVTEPTSYDRQRAILDVAWNNLAYGGLMVVDHVLSDETNEQAFYDFCKINSREPVVVKTRYGVGMVRK